MYTYTGGNQGTLKQNVKHHLGTLKQDIIYHIGTQNTL